MEQTKKTRKIPTEFYVYAAKGTLGRLNEIVESSWANSFLQELDDERFSKDGEGLVNNRKHLNQILAGKTGLLTEIPVAELEKMREILLNSAQIIDEELRRKGQDKEQK